MKLAKLNTKLFKVNLKGDNNYDLVTYRQLSLWVTRDQKAKVVKALRNNLTQESIDVSNHQVVNIQWGGF